MSRKALHLVVDLDIQAVTCPGVWLCPNGSVQLLLSMLGKEVQTKRLPPVFPLLFHEKVTFQKTFLNAGCLAEVQDCLGQEDVYAVLLQEVEDSTGGAAVQLARFHSNALHILYPSPCAKGLLAGVDVDLLMETSADYPGILSPKIELSTKTVVKEITSTHHEGYIINPKTLSSQKISPLRHTAGRQVETIHSDGQHRILLSSLTDRSRRLRQSKRLAQSSAPNRSAPTFLTRESQLNLKGSHKSYSHHAGKCGLQEVTTDSHDFCQCSTGHHPSKCPLCTQYSAMFGPYSHTNQNVGNEHRKHYSEVVSKKPSSIDAHEQTKRLSRALHAHVDRILEPSNATGQFNPFIPFGQSQSMYKNIKKHSVEKKNVDDSQNQASLSDPCFQVSCGSGDEFNSHRQLFYANLEKFYRKLYDRAKTRAQEENVLGVNK